MDKNIMYNTPYHTADLSKLNFLITGGAGFIGSHLVEYLLKYGAGKVRVLDNLSNGFQSNVDLFINHPNYEFILGDIRELNDCKKAVDGMHIVLHQAALGSVPRSINDPLTTHAVNSTGFLNMLWAVKENASIKRFIYAASSSTYGDSKELPKVEDRIGKPLSPYAITKFNNEQYADVFGKTYGLKHIGLRYFNVFGPRQSPDGAYAAVIPLFIKAVKEGKPAYINGNGEQTRDFTFIENAVQANIKAALSTNDAALNTVYNVACGERTSLNELWKMVNEIEGTNIEPLYREGREGDIKDSLAEIFKSQNLLNYLNLVNLKKGILYMLKKTIN